MNKLIFIFLFVLASCGQKYEVVLDKVRALKKSRDLALDNRSELFRHIALVEELIDFEVPKKTKIPAQVECSDFVLTDSEIQSVVCHSGIFNTCPRGFENYPLNRETLIERCEALKERS